MRKSGDRILTTHVGSLPAPPDLWNLEGVDSSRLSSAVGEVVQHQRDCGVDIVNEGEIRKAAVRLYSLTSASADLNRVPRAV